VVTHYRIRGVPESSLTHSMENKVSDGHEDHEWISTAALLVVIQAHRAHCADSQNDPMAGFSLPQAGSFEAVSLMAPNTTEEVEESPT
jgi:hypothetical protein